MNKKVIHADVWNRFTALDISEKWRKKLLPYFSYRKSGYQFSPAFRMGAWDGWVRMLWKNGRVHTGLFLARRTQIEKELGVVFQCSKAIEPPALMPSSLRSTRKYQNECVSAMLASCKVGGGLVLNATGTGKTFVAALFFSHIAGPVCFVVDELTLLYQARKEISRVLGEKVGIIGNQEFSPQRVTVCTSQTLHRHRVDRKFAKWAECLQVLVIDELHLAMNRRSFKTVEAFRPLCVFGLTATLELERLDVSTRAYALAGQPVFSYPLAAGVAEGFLAPGIVLQVVYDNPCGVLDYQTDYVDEIAGNHDRNSIVEALILEARRRKKYVITLVQRVAHLKTLSTMLHGVPHRLVYGKKKVEQRLVAQEKFEAGKVRVLLTNQVFKKGINIPVTDVIIDAAALKSKNDAVQKYGRGVRLCEKKRGLLYFDIADAGGKKGSDDENRFGTATRRRARAFKKAGILVVKAPLPEFDRQRRVVRTWACSVFDFAERKLRQVIRHGRAKDT